ncbi:phosphonopyruvate decarboxylase [Desulfonatronum thioautotrophicum]|uniref:phosphonopyruvate decarboxylase n=1 Tax=Desulfonatronum thioautotrophicum TaxID=617001 RepID=UPI0005EB63B4|nr:phosphonopyruvate decarboxylase [Desulfonatronum thioautotrophicum]
MLDPGLFHKALLKRDIDFFAGVPDSLLKNFCAYIDDQGTPGKHIITANEGNAVALATGYHLATGKTGAVYMQNSGLGNCINPLTSLTDQDVYNIPLLLIIGWRGEPGIKDEPQHIKQGRITTAQLDLLEIPYQILDAQSNLEEALNNLMTAENMCKGPVALLIRKKTFSEYKRSKKCLYDYTLKREEALRSILSQAGTDDLIVSTTGKTSRELFELRKERFEKQCDFLTVGSMGHASSIALGVAMGRPHRNVLCIDGDGAFIMHMGSLPIIGSLKPENFVHILLNNSAHESVGGQETVAGTIDISKIVKACGYKKYFQAGSSSEVEECWKEIKKIKGPVFLEIKVCVGSREDLGRPDSTPVQNKKSFMEFCSVC